jgi:hypothetical protein
MDTVEADFIPRAGFSGAETGWTLIGSSGSFSGSVTVTAGWYDLIVRATHNGAVVSRGSVPRVGVGEVFVVSGQSNAGNWSGVSGSVSPLQQVPSTDAISSLKLDGTWSFAQDPQPSCDGAYGSAWPHFGDTLYGVLSVPIGILCVNADATTVADWQPGGTLYDTKLNPALILLGTKFRALLWFQGESDTAHATTQADYETSLSTIITQSRTDAGWQVPWGIGLESYYSSGNLAPVLAAQTALADAGPATFRGPAMNGYTGSTYRSNNPDFSILGAQTEGELWVGSLQTYFGW